MAYQSGDRFNAEDRLQEALRLYGTGMTVRLAAAQARVCRRRLGRRLRELRLKRVEQTSKPKNAEKPASRDRGSVYEQWFDCEGNRFPSAVTLPYVSILGEVSA